MTATILRRLIQAIMVMIAMTMIVFLAVNVIGDPVKILIAPDADQIDRARLVQELGLDRPLWEQYLRFVEGALQGDLGKSYVYGESAIKVILQRLPATLELAICAALFAIIIGIPLGLYAGLRPDDLLSKMIMTGSILGFSLPTFWVGLMLIMIFAVQLGWLPSGGRGETAEFLGVQWAFLTRDGFAHLVLPAINLALVNASLVLRLTRAGVAEVLPLDYVKFARAKGLRERRVIGVHVLKNIMIPVVTVVGLEFGSIVAFSVVTESVFSWPGMGKLIIDSINVLDRPIITAYLMAIVVFFVAINFIVDLLYMALDPRVRLQPREA
jgi:peptide/nickel transport system permease protein